MRHRLGSTSRVCAAAASLVAAILGGVAPAPAEIVELVAEGEVFDLADAHGVLDPSVALGVPMRATDRS